ncbi:dihydrofolate reductase family protein [Microcella humidisoli]|uniref:Dihydrofolate reductase family protein n=1 Tax=Microcella humidisoli TaxID=2963406 RepID=A0ABY5FXC3_9MICO|nr:dihydrofolate reductase family protein [Microcella humidisoli]UTT62406.1 dihydrofolate reductase family protein [Microcella humidisoli]
MSGSTVYYVAQSLDGFIADRDEALDWLLAFGFDDFQQQYDAFIGGVGAIVMGAGTLRWLAAEGEPWGYTGTPTWVVSSSESLPAIVGASYERVADPVAAVTAARAAAAGRDVWVVGGGGLAGSLVDAGLLDRLHLTVMPVTIGAGTRVLPHAAASIPWQLESAQPIGSAGAVELRYRVRSS